MECVKNDQLDGYWGSRDKPRDILGQGHAARTRMIRVGTIVMMRRRFVALMVVFVREAFVVNVSAKGEREKAMIRKE